jgi:hypothetical protein
LTGKGGELEIGGEQYQAAANWLERVRQGVLDGDYRPLREAEQPLVAPCCGRSTAVPWEHVCGLLDRN